MIKLSHCRTNANVKRKKEIQKSRTVRVTVWNPSREVNHLGYRVLMMEIKVSKDQKTNTLADGLIERTSSMLDEIKSKSTHKGEEGD